VNLLCSAVEVYSNVSGGGNCEAISDGAGVRIFFFDRVTQLPFNGSKKHLLGHIWPVSSGSISKFKPACLLTGSKLTESNLFHECIGHTFLLLLTKYIEYILQIK
jgi:hypothetical protein